jgi:hypothetical protein
MKILIAIIFIINSFTAIGQCNINTTQRPDGNVLKFFNPQPIIREPDHEIGISIYENTTTNVLMLNVSVLFKGTSPQKLTNNAILQTSNIKGISLNPLLSELIVMNGRDVAIGLYEITENDIKEIGNNNLKSLFISLEGKITGSTVTENSGVLKVQLNCLKK